MPLSQELKDRVTRDYFPRYPTKRAALTMVLWLAQEEQGWLSHETVEEVADLLDLHPTDVEAVASFYSMFNRRPVGKRLVEVCRTHACLVNGARQTMAALCERLNLDREALAHGDATTPDGEYTVRYAECLAACDKAPAVQVNYRYFGPVTPDRVEAFLANTQSYSLEVPMDGTGVAVAGRPGVINSGSQPAK
jgi:NADH-quinone oxidoreductase subunit E